MTCIGSNTVQIVVETLIILTKVFRGFSQSFQGYTDTVAYLETGHDGILHQPFQLFFHKRITFGFK
jgi:hypothetical protein